MKLNKFRINIIWAYIFLATIICTVGIIVLFGSQRVMNETKKLYTNSLIKYQLVQEFRKSQMVIQISVQQHLHAKTLDEKEKLEKVITEEYDRNTQRIKQLNTHVEDKEEAALMDSLVIARNIYVSIRTAFLSTNHNNLDSAIQLNIQSQLPAYLNFSTAFDNLSNYIFRYTNERANQTTAYITRARRIINILLAISLMGVLAVGRLVLLSEKKLRLRNITLMKSESKFRQLLNSVPDAMIGVDKSRKIILSNKQTEVLFGYTAEELLNNDLEILLPEQVRVRHSDHFAKYQTSPVNRSMGSSGMPLFGRKKDGSEFPTEISLNSIDTEDGLLFLSTIRDISERKKTEQRFNIEYATGKILNQANSIEELAAKMLKVIGESLKWNVAALWMVDEKVEKLFYVDSWHSSSLTKADFDQVSHGLSFSSGVGLPGRAWESREPIWIDDVTLESNFHRLPFVNKSGLQSALVFPIQVDEKVVGVMEVYSYKINAEDKPIMEMLNSIGRQISQFILRKQAENELLQSEIFNRGVLNSLTSHIAVIDSSGVILAVNESWKRFGNENEVTEMHRAGIGSNYLKACQEASKTDDMVAIDALNGIMDVLDDKRPIFYQEYPCHSHDRCRWFSMRVTKFEGSEPMVVISRLDITERKLAESKLIRNNAELLKTNSELDHFVYSTSHDLRSPLTAVLGLTQFIEEETNEPDTLEHAKMIRSRIKRLDDFVKNILDYSRNNRLDIKTELINFEVLINQLINNLSNKSEKSNFDFRVNVDSDVPFYSDGERLRTIFENLIGNAIKYCNPNQSKNLISISVKTSIKQAEIVIEDNGIGIAEEHQDNVFDIFYRISGLVPGSGLGLYLVKETIEKLEGSIKVKSTIGEGTIFSFTIKNLAI